MLSSLNEWLWQEKFWLLSNYTWADLEDRDGVVYAHPRDLLAVLPVALVLLAMRMSYERFVALPLSRWLGLQDRIRKPVTPNPTLEKYFLTQSRRPKEPQLALLATQCGLTLRQTQRWFRRRWNQEQPQLSKKFCEASWRFLFYLCAFVGGLSVLYHEPWFWTPSLCWDNYPKQPLQPLLYWWYLLELGFFISLLMTLPFDVKRKDFKEQVVHHVLAIFLVTFSYSCNLLRIGSLVLLLHETSDYLLEAAKMLNYLSWSRSCHVVFLTFSVVFIYTRLVLFPTKILYTTYYESIMNQVPPNSYYFFNGLLILLQLLHVFWSVLILRVVFKFVKKGQMEKDIRSDVEQSDLSEEEATQKHPQLRNGSASTDSPRSRVTGRLTNGHTAPM
ncbi:PREDICTED: ceramide synthase 4-like [Elephantulus edwardii]|uniref:ceramide synthase 4-like n=1 Tax=Elephantulus edwardii TaxID=28737 RepID=UPI0003F08964|nr:PREDICTED: ceramide synthase 4-like [Elephantulus edwardii]